MLSLVELNASVAPTNVHPLLEALPVWKGAVPDHTGVKPFQSMHPGVSMARLPSASSKPEASAIVPSAPQPVIEASTPPPTDEAPAPEVETEPFTATCSAALEADVEASEELACVRAEADPSVSSETTT